MGGSALHELVENAAQTQSLLEKLFTFGGDRPFKYPLLLGIFRLAWPDELTVGHSPGDDELIVIGHFYLRQLLVTSGDLRRGNRAVLINDGENNALMERCSMRVFVAWHDSSPAS